MSNPAHPSKTTKPAALRQKLSRILISSMAAAAFFLISSTMALGSDYYFSSCATGGQGTKASPWCLDPNGDGIRDSIMYLFDGATPEAAPGDNIFLCAGACDGSGTATYNVSPTNTSPNYWFCPLVGGTISNPITIANYPGETVTISGDSNANGSYDSGTDLDSWISDACMNGNDVTDIHFVGQDVGGNKGLRFHYAGVNAISFINGNGGGTFDKGPNGWMFDGVEFAYVGDHMWDGSSVYAGCYCRTGTCSMSPPSKLFYMYYIGRDYATQGDAFTVKNCHITNICGLIFRLINNVGGRPHVEVKDNLFENSMQVDASFSNWKTDDNTKYLSMTYEGNTIRDVINGVAVKGGIRGWTVQDNTFICTGTKDLIDSTRRCNNAVIFIESPENAGYTSDIVVRRNKVYSTSTSVGWSGSIIFTNECTGPNAYHSAQCVGKGPVIENNMIWNHKAPYPGQKLSAAIGFHSNITPTVQNNTIVGGNGGIWDDTPDTFSLTPIIRNNLVYDVDSSHSLGLLHLRAGIDMSGIVHNNLMTTSGSSLVQVDSSAYSCAQINGGGAQIPATNKCALPSLSSYGGSPSTWDIHLSAADTADRDAGTPGPADDIDKQPRTGAVDVGADEIPPTDSVPPSTVTNLRFL